MQKKSLTNDCPLDWVHEVSPDQRLRTSYTSTVPVRPANEALRKKFAEMKDGHIRVVVVLIEDETLVAKGEHQAEQTFNQDFDKMIPPLIQKHRSAFYFVRLDTISELSGHNWLLIVYIPDDAKVRERMLYASTVATLKREFGLTYITQEIRAS
ncbi:unnamed protein product, partial [Rotaria magnacalcarata]